MRKYGALLPVMSGRNEGSMFAGKKGSFAGNIGKYRALLPVM